MECFYLTLCSVFILLSIQTGFSATDETMSGTTLIDGANGFALDVYKSLAGEPGNIFFSPISISFAIAMTSLGAKENTLKEMLTTIKMDSFDKDVIHSWFQELKNSLMAEEAQKDYTLFLANRLFGEKSYEFVDKFIQDTSTHYNATLEPVDFKANSDNSRIFINDWVSSVTNDKIKNLLLPGIVNSLTRLVLVNAIYFKGDWLSKFSSAKTKRSHFHVTETDIVNVELMHDKLNVSHGYSDDLKSQLLELPYKGEHLSMVVILPDLQETTFNEVEQALTPAILSSFHMHRGKCEVWLPKFKLESSFNLNDKLQQLGTKDLFQQGAADLSGIDGSRDLYVSSVVHKAFIEVNEEGSEAAAATAVVMMMRSRPIVPEFKADHPFIFYIKDNSRNSILFFGRFIRP